MAGPDHLSSTLAPMTSTTLTPRHIASRTAVALLGGYAFTWGLIAFGVTALYGIGLEFHDAEHLSYIVGLLAFLVAFLVAFAAQGLRRVAVVLVGGGALLAATGWWLQSLMV